MYLIFFKFFFKVCPNLYTGCISEQKYVHTGNDAKKQHTVYALEKIFKKKKKQTMMDSEHSIPTVEGR